MSPNLTSTGLTKPAVALAEGKPKVVGIYGVPGSGKSSLLEKLKHELEGEEFLYFEGSEMIAALVPGGLAAFQKSDEQQKTTWRQLAIKTIGRICVASGKTGVVTGHLMFWTNEEKQGHMVYTPSDMDTFTHILYLDVPATEIQKRRRNDAGRRRPPTSKDRLARWQQAEKDHLGLLCRIHGILFLPLASHLTSPAKVAMLLRDFHIHSDLYNLSRAEEVLDEIVTHDMHNAETVLVFDADKTVAPQDTGELFWSIDSREGEQSPLKKLFSSPLKYSYNAFRQATLLFEQAADDEEYKKVCQKIVSKVTMYPEILSLFRRLEQVEQVRIIVVSCGLRAVWEKVLEREGLSENVKVIAGGRIADGLVVTPAVKAAVVSRLQNAHAKYVWAFGDSPLDLAMLKKADQAVVVVGDEKSRSKSMDKALSLAINDGGLQARQILLPGSVPPRLDGSTLPVTQLPDSDLVRSIIHERKRRPRLSIFLATEMNSAKLLTTAMRDSTVSGPALREAHRRAGAYLATEYLTRVLGLEEVPIAHVQGHQATGHRLRHEQQTTIVAAMRGGEPMALGISDAFPRAAFVHAYGDDDDGDDKDGAAGIAARLPRDQRQIVLVDSVVNTGATLLGLVAAVRRAGGPDVRVVVVAGTVQARCLAEPDAAFCRALGDHGNVSLVALRSSDNSYAGRGGTDTGNRLFNTTNLD